MSPHHVTTVSVRSSKCAWCMSEATRLDLLFFARTACVLDALCHCLPPPPSLQKPVSEHGRVVMWNETDSAGRALSVFYTDASARCASHRGALISF